jgi:16S rRNA processing protein RimM
VVGEWPEQFVAIARIVRPQGRRGEVAAEILTDFPARFDSLRQVFLERPDCQPEPADVESARTHKGRIILKFAGIDSISEANRLRSLYVLIRHEERTALPARRYYVSDLVGCRVIVGQDEDGELGTVTGVEPTAGVDLLHVRRRDGRELLIPLAEAVCTRIDPQDKLIVVEPPEGLLELNP